MPATTAWMRTTATTPFNHVSLPLFDVLSWACTGFVVLDVYRRGYGLLQSFLISAACPCGKPANFAFASSQGLEVLPRWGLGENDFNFRFRRLLVWNLSLVFRFRQLLGCAHTGTCKKAGRRRKNHLLRESSWSLQASRVDF